MPNKALSKDDFSSFNMRKPSKLQDSIKYKIYFLF